jgi:hypothetical protein
VSPSARRGRPSGGPCARRPYHSNSPKTPRHPGSPAQAPKSFRTLRKTPGLAFWRRRRGLRVVTFENFPMAPALGSRIYLHQGALLLVLRFHTRRRKQEKEHE